MFDVRICVAWIALFTCDAVRADNTALTLAEHTPTKAVAYFGWAGSDALNSAYINSQLRAMIEGSNLPLISEETIPKLWDRIAGGASTSLNDAAHRSLPVLWHHPTAIYLTDVTLDGDGDPVPHFGLLCDAGSDADQLFADFSAIAKELSDGKLKVIRSGTVISLSNTDSPVDGPMLGGNAGFQAAMKPLQSAPAIAGFIDGAAMVRKGGEAASQNDSFRDAWPKVRDALGLSGFKSYAMTAGFDGGRWASASALMTSGPRTGLLATIEPRPVDPSLLARIPSSAESVAVANFDAAQLFDAIAAAMSVNPQADKQFHQATGVATMLLGANFRRELLGPLGPQWIVYTDARSHSVAVLNHPTDADTASDSLVSAAFGLINAANAQLPDAAVVAVQQKIDGINLTSAKSNQIAPFVGTPTFAVQDGLLYFGPSPEAVVTSARLKPVLPAADFFHDADFATALFGLRAPNAGSIDYCDLPRTAARAYERLKGEKNALDNLARLVDVDMPEIQLPAIDIIQPKLSAVIGVSWADADGIYTKSVSPFPGSAVLLGDSQESVVSLGTVSLAAGILMPAIAKARDQAQLVSAMKNERQILLAIVTWSMSHQGTCPPDLGSLVGMPQIDDLKVFLRHGSGSTVPPEIANGTAAQQADWVNQHAEFGYLTAGKAFAAMNTPATTPMLVQKLPANWNKQAAIGFADGHVEACSPGMVKKYLDAGQ